MSQFSKVENFWEAVKPELENRFKGDVYDMWFKPMSCLEQTDTEVLLSVPNEFSAIWVADNYLELILDKIRLVAGRPVKVSLKVYDDVSQVREQELNLGITKKEDVARAGELITRETRADVRPAIGNFLNPRNTFENFAHF